MCCARKQVGDGHAAKLLVIEIQDLGEALAPGKRAFVRHSAVLGGGGASRAKRGDG